MSASAFAVGVSVWEELTEPARRALLARPTVAARGDVMATVRGIVDEVRREGDRAVRRYTAELDLTQPVVACNCSMCGRAGWLLSFIPASKFHLEAGADSLTDYQFARRHIHHTFCKVCGVRPFSRGATPDGGEMIAVNVRCLADVDPTQLEIKPFDGKSL